MTDYLGPNPVVDELITQIGAILVGNRTFRGDDPYRGHPAKASRSAADGQDEFVLTHHPPADAVPGVTFVGDLDAAIAARCRGGRQVRQRPGRHRCRQCLAAGVLDEVLVFISPVLLGDGARLFEHPGGKTVRLEQTSVTHTPRVTNLWYRVSA